MTAERINVYLTKGGKEDVKRTTSKRKNDGDFKD